MPRGRPASQLASIALGGILGLIFCRGIAAQVAHPLRIPISRPLAVACLVIFLVLLVGPSVFLTIRSNHHRRFLRLRLVHTDWKRCHVQAVPVDVETLGNRTNNPENQFQRLNVLSIRFKYDPFGRRIYKSSGSVTGVYAYDGNNLVEETNLSGSVVADMHRRRISTSRWSCLVHFRFLRVQSENVCNFKETCP